MHDFTTGPDTRLQDAATKTLGRWLSAHASPVFLQVSQGNGRFAHRALAGCIGIFPQFELTESDRVAMATQALHLATRSNERNAAIQAMTRFPSVGTFELAPEKLDVPGCEAAAGQPTLTTGRTLLDLNPETATTGLKNLIEADVEKSLTDTASALLQ